MQVQIHRMLADHAQRAVRQAHFAASDGMTGASASLGDVGSTNGAEQLALSACLGVNGQMEILECLGALLRARELLLGQFLELRTPCLELRNVCGSRKRRLALRQKKIAPEPGAHFDPIADIAEVRDFLEKYDFHGERSVLVGVGKQSQKAGPLDRGGQLALIERLRARDAA